METYSITSFKSDIQKGKIGETIFLEDYLKFLRINFVDVTGMQGYQVIDTDFMAKIGLYEIKANYKDDKQIIIEEYTNHNPQLGSISTGWFYKSKADVLVFVSKQTRAMIIVPFTQEFKAKYESIKNNYELIPNGVSVHNGRKWQSAYRRIPLQAISGYFAYFKRPA